MAHNQFNQRLICGRSQNLASPSRLPPIPSCTSSAIWKAFDTLEKVGMVTKAP
jgi:hypothetical protein